MNEEAWKAVVGHENRYEVSNLGRVKSLARIEEKYNKATLIKYHVRERILKPTIAFGYPKVVLSINTKQRWAFVHRLLAQAFIPNPENKREVNHKDLNRMNCVLDNLEWTTSAENKRHAKKNGRYRILKGEERWCSKLNEDKVREIRFTRSLPNPPTYETLAKQYGVGSSTIGSAATRKTWTHI